MLQLCVCLGSILIFLSSHDPVLMLWLSLATITTGLGSGNHVGFAQNTYSGRHKRGWRRPEFPWKKSGFGSSKTDGNIPKFSYKCPVVLTNAQTKTQTAVAHFVCLVVCTSNNIPSISRKWKSGNKHVKSMWYGMFCTNVNNGDGLWQRQICGLQNHNLLTLHLGNWPEMFAVAGSDFSNVRICWFIYESKWGVLGFWSRRTLGNIFEHFSQFLDILWTKWLTD